MSKAFASNESEDEELEIARAPVLPPGTRNYITPAGAEKLEAAREAIIAQKTALGEETVENKQRRKTLDRRLEYFTERLNAAQIIDPMTQPKDRVLFGAQVTVRGTDGEQRWQIVGVDETDLDQGRISWISPLARALAEKRVGEMAVVGQQRLTILKIE